MAKNSTIILRVEDETRERLEAAAKLEKVTISEFIRRLIDQAPVTWQTKDRRQAGRVPVIKFIKDRRVNCKEE